jgi:hypothetical protein
MFKGADEEFKAFPWKKMAKAESGRKRTVQEEKKRIKGLVSKEKKKRNKLEALGIEYDYDGFEVDIFFMQLQTSLAQLTFRCWKSTVRSMRLSQWSTLKPGKTTLTPFQFFPFSSLVSQRLAEQSKPKRTKLDE